MNQVVSRVRLIVAILNVDNRGFSLLEGYLYEAITFAVRGWFLACYNGHGHIYDGVASK